MQSAVDLINQNRGKTVLVAKVKNIVQWLDQLPKPVFQNQSGPSGYILWKY
jgi:4-amino-4-deoxy-L-arabinose transferase